MNIKHPPQKATHLRAFSLIELLTVVAIIGILSSLAVTGFNSVTRGSGARGAADVAASLALSARLEALSLGYGSLLVIDNGPNHEQALQRMAVFRYTDETNVIMVGKPIALARGVYFLPDYSKGMGQTNLNLPGSSATPVYYYKFDGSGHLEATSDSRLVFSANAMDSSGNLQNPESLVVGRRGILLRNNGRPAFFQTPEQMAKNP